MLFGNFVNLFGGGGYIMWMKRAGHVRSAGHGVAAVNGRQANASAPSSVFFFSSKQRLLAVAVFI